MVQIDRASVIAGVPDGEDAGGAADAADLKVEPLVQRAPSPHCTVCVIVPVRDEAATIEGTLQALAYQVDRWGRPLDRERYEILLLANNCRDDSAAVARRFAQRHPTLALQVVEMTLPAREAHIGRVRRTLMDEAYRRLMALGRQRGVIASTDGDTGPAPDWISATLHEIAHGADAVGGRILTDRAERAALDPATRLYHLRDVGYRHLVAEWESALDPNPHDPWPRHYQHFGASLAVTAEAYRRAGGLPPKRALEDIALYRALERVDARFRHSPAVRVVTSARRSGRTTIGLAAQLSEWTAMGRLRRPYLVESAPAIEARLRARRRLRALWRQMRSAGRPLAGSIAAIARDLGVDAEWLADELSSSRPFGATLERVARRQQRAGAWSERWPPVEIVGAIADLRVRLDALRHTTNVERGARSGDWGGNRSAGLRAWPVVDSAASTRAWSGADELIAAASP